MNRVSQKQFDNAGTRPYMAPEQWRSRPQSAATDQYALAVVAYELLSGNLPFINDLDTEALRLSVLQDPPDPISEMSDHVNASLLTALKKDASERFESCMNFIEALGGGEIQIREPGTGSPPRTVSPVIKRKTATNPEVVPLMKRGNLFLEDSDWQQATQYFDRVLDIDPEYAPAYIGKLCAELKVKNEESLGDYEKPIADFGNFKKAVRFADTEYKATLERHNEKNQRIIWQEQSRIRQEQKRREEQEQIEQERRKKENEERERKRQDQEHSEVGRFCVEYGTDITAVDENGMTLLHTAAELGRIEVVKFFVSKGADVCSKSEEGLTPLHFAANVEVAQALFSAGAAVNVKDNDGCTPLDMALGQGNMALIEYFESIGGKSGVR
jgi:tetratricopeptide (TPR) repeat protein